MFYWELNFKRILEQILYFQINVITKSPSGANEYSGFLPHEDYTNANVSTNEHG